MINQKGQAIIILLLVMLVALTIGLTITQRSLSDVAISTKNEEGTRAFSAAEAGIEKALQPGIDLPSSYTIKPSDLGNQSMAVVTTTSSLPPANTALEYPPIGKETNAQFWLADPNSFSPTYLNDHFYVYFGEPNTSDQPAIEINLITQNGSNYTSNRYFFDSNSSRSSNGFIKPNNPGFQKCNSFPVITNANQSPSQFYCQVRVPPTSGSGYTGTPIMARIRYLYIQNKQKLALAPDSAGNNCPNNCSLPHQATIFDSKGSSGQSQKTLEVFRLDKVLPPYLDYAIFSNSDITK